MTTTIRKFAAAIGAALMLCATTAQARVESYDTYVTDYGSGSVLKSSKNWQGYKTKGYATKTYKKGYKNKGYSYTSYDSYGYTPTKKKRTYAGKKRSYSSGGGSSQFTSRSCLSSAARGLLSRIESRFGSVQIVSTCRPGARIAGTGKVSKHAHGAAIDFSAPGRKAAVVQWLIANHHGGGTMTYRDMDHIHVDVGARFVSLGANSGRS
jgi:hypothetical protein